MASLWLSRLVVLSSLVTAGSYKLPNLWLLIQDGSPGEGAHRRPANADSLVSAQRQWEWMASGEEGHGYPLLPRRKREDGFVNKNSATAPKAQPKKSLPLPKTTAETFLTRGKILKGKIPGPSPQVTSAPKKLGQEVATIPTTVGIPLSASKTKAPSHASLELGKAPAETKHPKDGPHFVTKGGAAVSPSASETVRAGKEAVTVALPEMGKVSMTTEHWPWLHDISSATSPTLAANTEGSTAVPKRGLATAGPVLKWKGKHAPSLPTATTGPTSDWRRLGDLSTASSQTLVDNSDVSTTTVKHGWATARRNFEGKDAFSLKTATASPTTWQDDRSTASSQTLVDTSKASTATERQGSRAQGKGRFSLGTTTARPTTATGAPVKPPRGTATVVGKCLLALFLLALVAAIFIVITAVLATMLWRQKRAYKMNQYNHTEMVCISSLLATEEAEEARGRAPRVKRVKMLKENGSETEMDNLTLNSFLPEH